MAYLMGVDLGTSGTKTALFDETGRTVASCTADYPLDQPQNGWAEQDPEAWWQAACQTIREVLDHQPEIADGGGARGDRHRLL